MLNRTSKADVDRARREELMSELIDVETREVSMSVLADREVYDLEMKHIFAKTWLMLAHQTEIPESGDYVVRDMGEDQVIVGRTSDGAIHVSLNIRSEEHTSELHSLMRTSYAVFCLKKKQYMI